MGAARFCAFGLPASTCLVHRASAATVALSAPLPLVLAWDGAPAETIPADRQARTQAGAPDVDNRARHWLIVTFVGAAADARPYRLVPLASLPDLASIMPADFAVWGWLTGDRVLDWEQAAGG